VCVGDDPYLISGWILDSIPFSFFQPSVMMAIRCPPANTAVGSRKRLRSSYMISKTTAPSSVIVYILALSGLASAYMDHRHREVGGDILPLIGRGTGALARGQLRDSDTRRKEIRNKWQRKAEDKSAWDIGVDGGHWDEWKDNPIKNRDEEEDGGGGFDDRQGDASTTEPTIYPTSEPTEEPTESVGNEGKLFAPVGCTKVFFDELMGGNTNSLRSSNEFLSHQHVLFPRLLSSPNPFSRADARRDSRTIT